MYKDKIKNANGEEDWNAPGTERADAGEVTFPEDVGRVNNKEYIRGYERYYKVDVNEIRIFEKFSGKEDLLTEEKFQEYLKKPAFIIEGQIITDPEMAAQLVQQMQMQRADNDLTYDVAYKFVDCFQ